MTIDELAKEFSKWRQNRKTPKGPIPPRLWKLAIEVNEATSISKVSKACSIPIIKLKRKMSPSPFVELPAIKGRLPIMEVTMASGTTIKIFNV